MGSQGDHWSKVLDIHDDPQEDAIRVHQTFLPGGTEGQIHLIGWRWGLGWGDGVRRHQDRTTWNLSLSDKEAPTQPVGVGFSRSLGY